ncbi:hypothetical protein F8M41_001860 [Gigaspora margarita]|uniref:Ion transport domain-containing protein n=1 Tax=Gigaspora margarita TaxID=4874 RepID=A0A8H3XDS9_GIGMA|nr:hypothetical protein F8M41_001860 [Gigaspora margarita]
MTSNSDNSYMEISMEEAPDKNKNKKILEIVCSPNLKHVAALHEHNKISLWSIVSQESQQEHLTNVMTINIDNFLRNEIIKIISDDQYVSIRKIFAISNNKQISISLDRLDPYNFKIFDFETPDKEIIFTFPDWQKEIDFLSFRDNGNIIMVNAKYYRAYVFSSKDNKSWVCKSIIELQYFKKIYITSKGILIMYNDMIHEITMWDIGDLSAKTRILIEWSHILQQIEISDDEELLAVYTTKLKIDKFHFIASSKGERLLYGHINIPGKYIFSLMDPYNLKNPINANKLFENKQIQEQYIIQSDKIIYTKDGEVFIEKLVNDYWVEYLRKELKDTNSITAPSKNTIDLMSKIIMESSYKPPSSNEFEGKFLKWSLELNNESVKLIVNKLNTSIKMQLEILPSLNINGKNYIVHCEVLENDDFVTITYIGVFIWTYILSEIKMHYYWNDWYYSLEYCIFEKINLRSLTDYWILRRILPASSYKTVLKNLHLKFGEKELFEEFLISDKCANICLKDKNYLISKIPLLSIIFENFHILSENHPAFILSTLSKIAFVVPFNVVYPDSIFSHLSSYGKCCHLSKISYLDILFPNLWVRYISFFQKYQKYFNQDYHSSTVLAIPLPNFVSYPKEYSFWKELLVPSHSPFSHSTKFNKVDEEFYKYLNGEALIQFKWDTYGWKYYFTIWAIYTIFLGSFIIVSTFSDNISWFYQQILLYIVIFLGFWHLFFEIRQLFIFSPVIYLSSSWNYLDSNINIFTQFSSTILASYYMMITGDSTPISPWISSENVIIMLLMTVASFIIVIYLMNILTGVLCDVAINDDNVLAYLALKREIIIQMELLYMLPYQRRRNDWFPFIIFYECDIIKLNENVAYTLTDKWSGHRKPYISQNLNEILLLPKEQPSLLDIEETLKNIETKIEELPVLKQDIKELKESIEDMKTNK